MGNMGVRTNVPRQTEEDLDQLWLSWRDDHFISAVGMLNTFNALEYFSRSPFLEGELDAQSVASSHRTQRLVVKGNDVEYILQDVQPPHLFVVRREQKTKAGDMPTAVYYILDGTIYQSPSLYNVFHSRNRRCAFKIREILDMLREDLNPINGTLTLRPVNMLDKLKSLEARQQGEFTMNSEMYVRSDQLIATILSTASRQKSTPGLVDE